MTSPFDALALRYDELWTHSAAGRAQRSQVWRHIDSLLPAGSTLLDLGCGTGEDARHFMRAGLDVQAIDSSPEMVRIASSRGVEASALDIENIASLTGSFDAVLSNFGALNCVADLGPLRAQLARLIRPGGHLIVCIMGRICLWETVWYLLQGTPGKAIRRWSGASYSTSLDIKVLYPTARSLRKSFARDFELLRWTGIGLLTPPSYVPGAPRFFDSLDRRLAHRPGLRALADHQLFIFTRK